MNENEKYLYHLLNNNNIKIDNGKTKKLCIFYDKMTEKNKVMNLTSITEFKDVCIKHFLDSLSILFIEKKEDHFYFDIEKKSIKKSIKVIDVGCGAGFPGLVLAIAFPYIEFTLLDSLNKRVEFIDEMINILSLDNCRAVHYRAEDAAKQNEFRQNYDIAVSRAVANLSTLTEYCLPFVKKGGYFVAYKSEKIKNEAGNAKAAIEKLGGIYESETEFYLDEKIKMTDHDLNENIINDNKNENYRNLYMIKKIKDTPLIYPRKAGLPSKKPL